MSLIPESATKKFGDKIAEKESKTPEGYVEDVCFKCGEKKLIQIGNNCCDGCQEEISNYTPEKIKQEEENVIGSIELKKTEENQPEPKKKKKPKKKEEPHEKDHPEITVRNNSIICREFHEGEIIITTYDTIDKCINCGKDRLCSGKTAGCPICDKVMSEKDYEKRFPSKPSSTPKEPEVREETEENLFPDEEPLSSTRIKQLAQEVDLTVEEIRKLMEQKKQELKGLVSDDGAFFIVAKELGSDITPEKPKKKKKTTAISPKEKIVKEYDLQSHPILALVWGADGTSKSEQIMKFVDSQGRRPLIFDLENKLLTIAKKLNFPLENIVSSGIYNQEYEIDGPTTLQELRNELQKIKTTIRENKGKLKFSAIALDGISDLRPFAEKEWLEEHPNRQKANTEGDMSEINVKVRDIVVILLNMGRAEQINTFFTAQLGQKYLNKKVVGDKPNCKEWIWFNIDHKFKLYVENNRFYAFCEKSYYDPFFTIDLTDFTHSEIPSLFNILQDPILIEKYKLKEKIENIL